MWIGMLYSTESQCLLYCNIWEKLQYQWNISFYCPDFFFTSPLCPRTQRPCCRLRDWSQWEKMISLLLPRYHPHSFFFFLPQASPSQPTSYSPLFLFLSLSRDPLFLNRAQKTLNLEKKLWFFCESLSNFIHKEDTLKRAHSYTWAIHCVVLCTVLCKGLETSIFLE